jgi:inner membrane transporter RhtA
MSAHVGIHRPGLSATRVPVDVVLERARRAGTRAASRAAGPASVVAASASLQSGAAIATTTFAAFGAGGTAALRFAAGAALLLAWSRPHVHGRDVRAWLRIAVLGLLMAAASLCLFQALARVPLGTAVTLQFLGPLTVALAAARRRLDAACAVAAAGGVVLLTGGPSGASAVGVAFALGAAASIGATIPLLDRVAAESDGLDGLALSVLAAALVMLPIGLPAGLGAGAGDLAQITAVGLLGVAIPYALFFDAVRRVGAKTYSILLSLDPAVAALAGAVLLGQQPGLSQLAGIAIVVVASATAVATRPAA